MSGLNRPPAPDLSVVIPAHGRPGALAGCLEALSEQTLPSHRFEVVVVDDGSPEPLAPTLAGVARPRLSRMVRQENRGPAAARNRGAAEARGRLLAFTDDDCRPAPGWAEALVGALERSPGAVIGGRTLNALATNPYAEASQLLVDYLYEEPVRTSDPTPFFTSNNLAVTAADFAGLGGFDPVFRHAAGEDRDFCDRAAGRGHSLVYEPRARVDHAHAMGLGGFWRQHLAYGRGARLFHRRRARRGRSFPRPRIRFYLGLLAFPWRGRRSGGTAGGPEPRPRPVRRRVALTLLLALSQLANAVGFLHGFLRREGA